jgi:peptide/nickel transport system permease protein
MRSSGVGQLSPADEITTVEQIGPTPSSRGRRLATAGSILRDPSGSMGAFLLGALIVLAFVGPLVIDWEPNKIDPNLVLKGPSLSHPFGTDQTGRDQLARVMDAIPVALLVTFVSAAIAMVCGAIIGVAAGFLGGNTERLGMWTTDLLLSMPPLLMAIVITGIFGSGLRNTIIAISIIYMPRFVRIARGATLSVRSRPYVDGARLAGTRPTRLVIRHIVPGILPSLIVMTTLTLSTALLAASALSFLGLGLRPPAADLGSMLSESVSLIPIAPWLVIFPSIVLVLMIIGFNLLGDAVGNVLDPRLASEQPRTGV